MCALANVCVGKSRLPGSWQSVMGRTHLSKLQGLVGSRILLSGELVTVENLHALGRDYAFSDFRLFLTT